MLRSAAGALATARNMLGLAPKAAWMVSSNCLRSGVVLLRSINGMRFMVDSLRSAG